MLALTFLPSFCLPMDFFLQNRPFCCLEGRGGKEALALGSIVEEPSALGLPGEEASALGLPGEEASALGLPGEE
jgi:hypothetical protein